MEFHKLSALEIAEGVKNGKWKASEVLSAHLERIRKYDGRINSVVTLSEESARKEAEAVDRAVAEGRDPGRFAGVPFLAKDNFCTEGIRTTCCSKMLEDWIPDYDATAVKRMKEAGAVLIGESIDIFGRASALQSVEQFAESDFAFADDDVIDTTFLQRKFRESADEMTAPNDGLVEFFGISRDAKGVSACHRRNQRDADDIGVESAYFLFRASRFHHAVENDSRMPFGVEKTCNGKKTEWTSGGP